MLLLAPFGRSAAIRVLYLGIYLKKNNKTTKQKKTKQSKTGKKKKEKKKEEREELARPRCNFT